jgi:lysophospholipase L1-like esterase
MVQASTPASLAVFGDSVAAGMGARGDTYGQMLATDFDLEYIGFANSAQCVPESLERLLKSDVQPSVAIIAHGITEAILRPSGVFMRLVPPRWRATGWMDPRPYFSSAPSRRFVEKIESGIRWRVKNAILRWGDKSQKLSKSDYTIAVRMLIDELERRGTYCIVLGPPDIDARFFPGSEEQLKQYLEGLIGAATVVTLSGRLKKWDDFSLDHFHPNDSGHERIRDILRPSVDQALKGFFGLTN